MGIVLDSNIIIKMERERGSIEALCPRDSDREYYVSVISASELLYGVHRAKNASLRQLRSAFVEAILGRLPILEIDFKVARAHALLWSELVSKGTMIGLHDSWIAATCIAHGFELFTNNKKEFARVPGLTLQ